jgi:serine/threonine-protein kinase
METRAVIGLNNRLVLNSDVVIRPAKLARDKESGQPGDEEFVITRSASRSPSLALNREAAEFLLAFAAPCSLLSAVQLIANRVASPPETVLDEIHPTLRMFLERGILVRTGNARRVTDVRQIGGWFLQRRINDFDDSSVFLVKNTAGQFGALKLIRPGMSAGVLERERRVLELAGNDIVPALLGHGSSTLGHYLVSEWKAGPVAADAFRELRNNPDSKARMLRLAVTLVEAFERLHERGIVHGDIQPKNVIFDLHNTAWIIDFSHSIVPGLPVPVYRMGVPFFFEPEYAKSVLDGAAKQHPPTIRGENYAIAAMVYYLLSGVHSIEFSPERETLLRQVAEIEPRPLTDGSGARWDEADDAIRPFLSKDPERRPASLAELRESLAALIAPDMGEERSILRIQRETHPVRKLREEFGLGSARMRNFDVAAPRCSLTFGAPGIAYGLLRAAELCGDAELLWAADAWIELAQRHMGEPEAYTAPAIDLTRRKIGYASLACAEPGLWFAKSLVRAAVGDSNGASSAVDQFLSASKYRPSHHSDVNLGGVGLALAADRLARLRLPAARRRELREFRDQLIDRAAQARNNRLGFAHGVAGMIFAALTKGELQDTRKAVAELQKETVMMRRGVRWPVRFGSSYFMPGWCNGVAGHLLMWTRLWQLSGVAEDREMMERVAWGVLESVTAMGNVCCGAAGQAIALACFASAAGDPSWRRRASAFIESLRPRWPKDDHPQSLFRGELGLLLARLECDSDTPRFPVWGASLNPSKPRP